MIHRSLNHSRSLHHSRRPAGRHFVPYSATAARGGTLVEVLIALAVMVIGVVAVATLFPSSVLRSVNAHKLTNATLLRLNAEAAIDTLPDELVHNPHQPRNGRSSYFGRNYMVDPLGWNHPDLKDVRSNFGNGAAAPPTPLKRYNGQVNSQSQARTVVTLPDSWIQQLSATISGFKASSATLTDVDASDLAVIDIGNPPSRIVLINDPANGRRSSHTRVITSISGLTVKWNRNLPAGFTPTEARIETQERRFTWLLTVRNHGRRIGTPPNQTEQLNANVDVVVYFNRTFSQESERVFRVNFTGGTNTYRVTIPGSAQRPRLKKGEYLLDVNNARWYRIQKLINETSASPSVVLESGPPTGEGITRVIFQANVVEVYPLAVKNKGTSN